MNIDKNIEQDLIDVLQHLIQYKSITPDTTGIQDYIALLLEKQGFSTQRFNYKGVNNLVASIGTNKNTSLCFAGHTDVVSAEDKSWNSNPFLLTSNNHKMYGRGTSDMKGALAAMIIASKSFLKNHPIEDNGIHFIITGDEEGEAKYGTKHILNNLDTKIDYCIVGEPTAKHKSADTIKVGRRGSLSGKLKIYGKSAHVAYSNLSNNIITDISSLVINLSKAEWGLASQTMPRTTFQITSIDCNNDTENMTPHAAYIKFNFRYNDKTDINHLKKSFIDILNKNQLSYDIAWIHNSSPFINQDNDFTQIVNESIYDTLGYKATVSTSGGTSDARFFAEHGVKVIELGLQNNNIHADNEFIFMEDLKTLTKIYSLIMEKIFYAN